MRARSGSGVRLDRLMHLVEKTILQHQDPVTGLFSTSPIGFPNHGWVRDNVYAGHAIWGMYRAYQKSADFDEDVAKANELGQTCVKLMQSLLECMMRQTDKVEAFKRFQKPSDSLHAKYSVKDKGPVVGDAEWGHLQIDAVSLFLLTLAQMSASGLQIVRNFDEVAFIQNLVYYIELAYRIPDYGIWERGDKTNQGIRELNASSIGMAKAAMQAVNDVGDLFGDGSKGSVIHVLPDEIQQCAAVLSAVLPRESFSKETDAALLSIISYPAFSVEDPVLIGETMRTIEEYLLGNYGCRRFLRDGYKTVLEDPNRLYYNNAELQQFENIECEWPLFACFLLLDALFRGEEEKMFEYRALLDRVVIKMGGIQQVPELYKVPREKVAAEQAARKTQERVADGRLPYIWAQSLYIVCQLIMEGFLTPAELDPLSRRLSMTEKRPPTEVQVVVLAENAEVQSLLRDQEIQVQTRNELDRTFNLQPPTVLAKILARVGSSTKMNLTGRPDGRDVGILSTSKLYQLGNKFIVFTPQFMEPARSHLMYDIHILADEVRSELQYLHDCWNSYPISGRPLLVIIITKHMLHGPGDDERTRSSVVIGTLKKLKTGYLGGSRVVMKNMADFFRTTAVSKLEFRDEEPLDDLLVVSEAEDQRVLPGSGSQVPLRRLESVESGRRQTFSAIHKQSMRHRSIILDSNDADLQKLRLQYYADQVPKSPNTLTIGPPDIVVEENEPDSSGSETETGGLLKDVRSFGSMSMKSMTSSAGIKGIRHSWSDQCIHTDWILDAMFAIDIKGLEEMDVTDVVNMLNDTECIDEQGSIVHYLWMKKGPTWDTKLNGIEGTSVRKLMEELYMKACTSRNWVLVRLSAGLLEKRLEELPKAVTHLLVRQKQITVGNPSQNEEAITTPKNPDELVEIMNRAYGKDPNSNMLAQEIIVCLGSLVRTDTKLFDEMFRLRIGLIIQVLASELARAKQMKVEEASMHLLSLSPYELKNMLFSLLSGRLVEDTEAEGTKKEERSGLGQLRREIAERKRSVMSMRQAGQSIRAALSLGKMSQQGSVAASVAGQQTTAKAKMASPSKSGEAQAKSMRASMHMSQHSMGGAGLMDLMADSDDEEDAFVFGVWLRHRRIDGALNRVPKDFYMRVWETVRKFPQGLVIANIPLHWGLTQEMTRREIKFALQVESVLNRIPEPEYRELMVEGLALLSRLEQLLKADNPRIPHDAFHVDRILHAANSIFVEHNKSLETIVIECCAADPPKPCDGARGICRHFYDSAPAGEYGTAHYILKAMMNIFCPDDHH